MRSAVLGLVIILSLAGCPGPNSTTRVDEARLAVMLAEPLVKKAISEPSAKAGFRISDKLPPHRSEVTATLFEQNSASPDVARDRTAESMVALDGSGWTVYFTACVPLLEAGESEPSPTVPVPARDEDWWQFLARGYKVIDNVSYYAELTGTAWRSGKASVSVRLIAPNARESTSDLFTDRPQQLPPGQSCLDTGPLPQTTTVNGALIIIGQHGPDPDGFPNQPIPPGER